MKKTVLVITDGIGYNPNQKTENFNAFKNAHKPTYDYLFEQVPNSLIKTSGLAVGLPDGQMGNSEVGHMCIGSGRVIYQNLVKISKAIEEDTLQENPVLVELLKASARIHIVGLLSDGGVHSHIEHIIALAKIAKSNGKKVFLHLITDGRDVDPRSAKKYVAMIEEIVDEDIVIATIGGRFYTMDRDKRWERVQKGFEQIYSAKDRVTIPVNGYVESQYEKDIVDEFLEPVAFGEYCGVEEGDGFIFANFRSDRMREIVEAIGDEGFAAFEKDHKPVALVTMTTYDKNFPYPVIYPNEVPHNTLAEVVSKHNLTQLHTAETEKYAHVTFFLNGGVEEPFLNESRVLIPSPKVKTYDMQPQMSAPAVGDAVLSAMDEGYDLVIVNFANGDMVGHTGVYEAGIEAVEAVDRELGRIVEKAKEKAYAFVLTSDHGNCEEMKDEQGNTLTNHTTGEVFCFVMSEGVESVKEGALNNIAPTVLTLMGVDIPEEMDDALI
jgi:2,3-bisphosphoglycerate-independent phosphoglycerate mutase